MHSWYMMTANEEDREKLLIVLAIYKRQNCISLLQAEVYW